MTLLPSSSMVKDAMESIYSLPGVHTHTGVGGDTSGGIAVPGAPSRGAAVAAVAAGTEREARVCTGTENTHSGSVTW